MILTVFLIFVVFIDASKRGSSSCLIIEQFSSCQVIFSSMIYWIFNFGFQTVELIGFIFFILICLNAIFFVRVTRIYAGISAIINGIFFL